MLGVAATNGWRFLSIFLAAHQAGDAYQTAAEDDRRRQADICLYDGQADDTPTPREWTLGNQISGREGRDKDKIECDLEEYLAEHT